MRIPRARETSDYGLSARRPFGTGVLVQHESVIVPRGVLHDGTVNGLTIVGRDTAERKLKPSQ